MLRRLFSGKKGSEVAVPSSGTEEDAELEVIVQDNQIVPSSIDLVYLLIDCSDSMDGRNKLRQAKEGAKEFALDAQEKGYAVGLIEFSSYATCLLDPLQGNQSFNLYDCISRITIGGGTNMTDAIEMATRKFSPVGGLKAILVATDGQPHNRETALNAALRAKNLGITIITVGTDDADIIFLKQISSSDRLATKVASTHFKEAISSAALSLPAPKKV